MKRFVIILAGVLLISSSVFGGDGNVDGIGGVDLKDVIMSLQISDGLTPPGTVNLAADVNGDGKIGPPEAIYGLQVAAGLRISQITTVWYKDADGDRYSDATQTVSETRPSGYYKESELLAVSGDPNDNDPQIVPVGGITEIARIQTSIQTTGAAWVAETNPVSQLPTDQRKMRLGAILPASIPQSAKRSFTPRDNPPAYFDWRNNNGNFVTPIKDQGGCGSCWAFSAVAALESQVLMRTGQSKDLSEQIVVSCSGAGSCNGGYPTSASDFLRNTGTNTESCYPYTQTDGNCSNACANWQNGASKIDSWSYVNDTVTDIKNAIYVKGPLVTTMAVYTDFFSYRSGVYRYTWGQLEGYHAIVVVGWDDASSSFIVKNSWSAWWGDSGYYRIAYSEVTGNSIFGYLTIAYTTNPSCTYTISPQNNSFTPSGGSGSISVTAASGCTWTAANNAPSWITITSGPSGNGNGTVGYSVSAYTGTSSRTGTITIGDKVFTITQTAPQIIQFSSSAYSVGEADGSALITVTRTGDTSGTVSVNYGTGNGTAENGSDYTSVFGNVIFSTGETGKTFTVGIINDTAVEGNETVNLTLSSPGSGAILGTPSSAILTIADDDVAQKGQIQFGSASYSISESGGSVSITVTRTGGSSGAVSVSYSVGGGNAISGNDYSATSGTITFADGDTTAKTFSVPILNDSLVEGNETANLTLSNPTGGATLGTPSSAVLTITDDDTPPTVDLFLQNETVTTTLTYTTSNSIWAGYDVTTQKPYGDYVIQSGGNVTLNSKTIYLKPGFKASSGSTFKATAQ